MSAIVLVVLGLGGMALGYIFYSRFIAKHIYQLNDDFSDTTFVLVSGKFFHLLGKG